MYYSQVTYTVHVEEKHVQHYDVTTHTRHKLHYYLCNILYFYYFEILGSSDFTGGTYSYTIPSNQQEATVSIPILDDVTVEQLREQFSVDISLEPQPGLSLGNSQGVVTIIDDDGKTFTTSSS